MRSARLHFLAVLVGAALLIGPLFKTKYLDYWGSIDSTFIADARYLAENWPHPGWQPLWYGGTRFDYVYPPAIRWGSAALVRYAGVTPARGYHLYTAILYAFGIAGVWLLVWTARQRLGEAWLAAAGAALLSPAMLFLPEIRGDADPYMPQRLNVLLRYGEGPHMSALAMLPYALAAAWTGLQGRWSAIVLSALASMAVVANNFYGATTLALFFPILCWSIFITTRDWRVWLRAGAIAALAYGFTAFWLTPSFVTITSRNLQIVSKEGNAASVVVAFAAAALFAAISWRWAWDRPQRAWTIFVGGAALFICLNVLGQYYFNFRVAGEPGRLVPECDLLLILAGVEAIRRVYTRTRLTAAAVAIVVFGLVWPYWIYPWRPIVRTIFFGDRIEYKIAEWVEQHRPGERTFVTGNTRFWWNAWHSEAQIGGGSEQGLTNFDLMPMYWRLFYGMEQPEVDIHWMQAVGVDMIVMNDQRSALPIQDFQAPHKFMGPLPVIWDDGAGNWIHEVPRRTRSLARIVDTSAFQGLLPPRNGDDGERLAAYAAVVENPATPQAFTEWRAPHHLHIEAAPSEGQSVLAMVSYDDGWNVFINGNTVPFERDVLGQIVLHRLPPATKTIDLVWTAPFENQVGRMLTAASILVSVVILVRSRRSRS